MSLLPVKQPPGPASDWIHLRDIDVRCILGVYPGERQTTRQVLINVSLQCNLRPAGVSDQLDDTLNYERIETAAIAIAQKGGFSLLEALAEKIASACLQYPAVRAVRVTVDKPAALPHTRSVAVTIERRH